MPNVTVYVSAAAWRALEQRGDPAVLVRAMVAAGLADSPHVRTTSIPQTPEVPQTPAIPRAAEVPQAPAVPKSRSSSCTADAPRGTRCKLCGKVHPV